jgi:hypothetical protein
LFTADAELLRPGGATITGRDAIRASYASRAPTRITRHVVANVVVDVDSPQEARALSYVVLWSGSSEDGEQAQGRTARCRQVGEFHDRFVLTPAGWRIARREARFVLRADD